MGQYFLDRQNVSIVEVQLYQCRTRDDIKGTTIRKYFTYKSVLAENMSYQILAHEWRIKEVVDLIFMSIDSVVCIHYGTYIRW